MPALLAIAAACTFGVADFLGGLSTRKAAVVAVTLITNLAGAALTFMLVVVIDGVWSVRAVGWGTVATTVPVVVGVALGDRPDTIAIVGICVVPIAMWLHERLARDPDNQRPWSIDDAPRDFIDKQVAAIVGIEIAIATTDHKRKMSQNKSEPDRAGAANALRRSTHSVDQSAAELMDPRHS